MKLQDEKFKLSQKLIESKSEFSNVQSENAELKLRITELEKSNITLCGELKEAKSIGNEKDKQINQLNCQIEVMNKDKANLFQLFYTISSQNKLNPSDFLGNKDEIENLKSQLNEKCKLLEEREQQIQKFKEIIVERDESIRNLKKSNNEELSKLKQQKQPNEKSNYKNLKRQFDQKLIEYDDLVIKLQNEKDDKVFKLLDKDKEIDELKEIRKTQDDNIQYLEYELLEKSKKSLSNQEMTIH